MELDNITKFENDMKIIGKLDDEPNDVAGLSAAELKAKFDEGGITLQKYINDVLIPGIESLLAVLNEGKAEKEELQNVVLNQVPDGTITSRKIAAGGVESANLAPEAVTEDKLSLGVAAAIKNKAEAGAFNAHVSDFQNPHQVSSAQVAISEALSAKLGLPHPSSVDAALGNVANDVSEIDQLIEDDTRSTKVARIQSGSYVGTGKGGASNPTQLKFSFVPKVVAIFDDAGRLHKIEYSGPPWLLHTSGLTTQFTEIGGSSDSDSRTTVYAKKASDGKTISIYAKTVYTDEDGYTTTTDKPDDQCNKLSAKYHFVGIG